MDDRCEQCGEEGESSGQLFWSCSFAAEMCELSSVFKLGIEFSSRPLLTCFVPLG